MIERDEVFDARLRSAAPEFILTGDFTERVMRQTVYRPARAVQPGNRFYQLRLAGVSMILAGFLIMATNAIPVNDNLNHFKTSLRSAFEQAPHVQLPWVEHQNIHTDQGGR